MSKSLATLGTFLFLAALAACSASNQSRSGRGASTGNAGSSGGGGGGDGSAGIGGGGQITGGTSVGGNAGSAGSVGSNAVDSGTPGPVSIDRCSGAMNMSGLTDANVATLMAGSGQANGMRYLYPYDGTIFPRGLIAPTLMWEGADDAEAVYVHVKSSLYELKGCYKPTAPGQLLIPQDVWTSAESVAQGETEPYSVELSVITGGVAKGPIKESLVIAQATLKGAIFYNSYASKLSPGAGSVLRIVPGNNVELFVNGTGSAGCNGCHAMSAGGTRLVTDMVMGNTSAVYALDSMTQPNPPTLHTNTGASFVGLSPTGAVYVTNRDATPTVRTGTTKGGSVLIETDTGNAVTGSGVPTTAAMPTFSPDGKMLAFNDSAISAGHGLALMDYDVTARKASNYRQVYENANMLPGWPFVLPDNKAIVFQLGAATDFSGGNVGIDPIAGFSFGGLFGGGGTAPTTGPWGNLFVLDLASGKAVVLAKAMGYGSEADAAAGKSYLPYATDELNMNYYPTVSPVAAGGYFWVFFDSERHYGNKGLHRQLWGTAVTISASGTYAIDPSHPAFFLTGQEEGTGNHRAFTALTPCKVESDSCKTGIDCCGGFCEFPAGQNEFSTNPMGTCHKPEQHRCSKLDEACTAASDCCDTTASCIAGFCAYLAPQ